MKGVDALNALWDALESPHKKPPPDAISAADYAEKFGVCKRTARDRLDAAVKAGKLEVDAFRVDGFPTKYYRLAIQYSGKKKK